MANNQSNSGFQITDDDAPRPATQDPATDLPSLDDAIARAEGAHPADNNPGNLSLAAAQKMGVPVVGSRRSAGVGATDIAQFPDAETGRQAHIKYLSRFPPDTTFGALAATYAPGQDNWLKNVTTTLGAKPGDKIGPYLEASLKKQAAAQTAAGAGFQITDDDSVKPNTAGPTIRPAGWADTLEKWRQQILNATDIGSPEVQAQRREQDAQHPIASAVRETLETPLRALNPFEFGKVPAGLAGAGAGALGLTTGSGEETSNQPTTGRKFLDVGRIASGGLEAVSPALNVLGPTMPKAALAMPLYGAGSEIAKNVATAAGVPPEYAQAALDVAFAGLVGHEIYKGQPPPQEHVEEAAKELLALPEVKQRLALPPVKIGGEPIRTYIPPGREPIELGPAPQDRPQGPFAMPESSQHTATIGSEPPSVHLARPGAAEASPTVPRSIFEPHVESAEPLTPERREELIAAEHRAQQLPPNLRRFAGEAAFGLPERSFSEPETEQPKSDQSEVDRSKIPGGQVVDPRTLKIDFEAHPFELEGDVDKAKERINNGEEMTALVHTNEKTGIKEVVDGHGSAKAALETGAPIRAIEAPNMEGDEAIGARAASHFLAKDKPDVTAGIGDAVAYPTGINEPMNQAPGAEREVPDLKAENVAEQVGLNDNPPRTPAGLRPAPEAEGNRVFTKEGYDAAKKNLQDKLNRQGAGIDPTALIDLARIGGYHLENGLRDFKSWSEKMLEDFGEGIRPYLSSTWDRVNNRAVLTPNASGESAASQEAINRQASEKAQGVTRFRVDTRTNREFPITGVDAVDQKPGKYDVIAMRDKEGRTTVLDRGERARDWPNKGAAEAAPKSEAEKPVGQYTIGDEDEEFQARVDKLADKIRAKQPGDPVAAEQRAEQIERTIENKNGLFHDSEIRAAKMARDSWLGEESKAPEEKPQTAKEKIESRGLVYKGELVKGSGVHQFEESDRPSQTMALNESKLTDEGIKAKIDESRAKPQDTSPTSYQAFKEKEEGAGRSPAGVRGGLEPKPAEETATSAAPAEGEGSSAAERPFGTEGTFNANPIDAIGGLYQKLIGKRITSGLNDLVNAALGRLDQATGLPLKRAFRSPESFLPKDYLRGKTEAETTAQAGKREALTLGQKLSAGISQRTQQILMDIIQGKTDPKQLKIVRSTPALQEALDAAKVARLKLDDLGAQSVMQDMLRSDTFFKNYGKYVPRLYRKYEVDYDDMAKRTGEAAPNRIDLDRFSKRDDIPPIIRAQMGEIKEAAYPVAKGIADLSRAVAYSKFFENVSKNPEFTLQGSGPAPEGWIKLPETPSLGKLSGKTVNRDIGRDVNEMIQTRSEASKFFGDLMGKYKRVRIIWSPASFVWHNLSRVTLNYLDGLPPYRVDIYAKALMDRVHEGPLYQRAVKAGVIDAAPIDPDAMTDLIDNWNQSKGTLSQRMMSMGAGMMSTLKSGKDYTGDFWNHPYWTAGREAAPLRALTGGKTDKVGQFYSAMDQWMKMSKFAHNLEKGMPDYEAGVDARKATIDYRNVPKLVDWGRRTVTPFITFPSQAIPRLAKSAVEAPWRLFALYEIGSALNNYARNQLGMTKEDEDRARNISRPQGIEGAGLDQKVGGFNRFLLLPQRSKNGDLQFLDLSHLLHWTGIGQPPAPGVTPFGSERTGGDLALPAEIAEREIYGHPITSMVGPVLFNRDPYTGKEVYGPGQEHEGPGGALAERAWKTWTPSIVPGGFTYNKVKGAVEGRPDYFGRPQDVPSTLEQAATGLNVRPLDEGTEAMFRDREFKAALDDIRKGQFRIESDARLTDDERKDKLEELDRREQKLEERYASIYAPQGR